MKGQKTNITYLSIAILLFSLGGCGSVSLSQVSQFGTASTELNENAKKAFNLIDQVTVERQLYSIASDTKTGPTDNSFNGLFKVAGNDAQAKEKAERLKLRLNALDALSGYSSALKKIVEADVGSDIDSASLELNTSLVELKDTYQKASHQDSKIDNETIGLLATAVNAIGRAVVEEKKRSAIKEIIIKVDPAVQQTAIMISKDLGSNTDLAKYAYESLYNTRGSIQTAYNLEKKSNDFDSRYALLVRAKEINTAENSVSGFFNAVSKGSEAIAKTHAAMRKAVEQDQFSSAEVGKSLAELQKQAKSVREFQSGLKEQ
ncbi:hypothetical protein [Pseudomonas sp. BF-RE-29]|uniref:hypothetical protein n=1 Tax=Pseudomonas sp. BF-RE-29 TaxID=2832378 RepID=UPI001CBB13E3|nr:hypothetical protein [Pseudomonas sp. BF-RE-29]